MYMKFMASLSIACLLFASIFIRNSTAETLTQFVVCAAAILIVLRAFEARQYGWMAAIVAVGIVFNPIFPWHFSSDVGLWINAASIIVLALCLQFVKTPALLTVESVVNTDLRRSSL
jgi:predicted membrane protein